MQGIHISAIDLIMSILLCILLSLLIGFIYVKYGRSISDKKDFSSNFTLLTITTLFIIAVVKSSLALSLGLVGALSIVRFRSAIKEPEELIYLFICISIGLGLGANQILPTILSTLSICIFVFLREKFNRKSKNKYFNLLITYPKNSKESFDRVIDTIQINSQNIDIQRYSEDNEMIESSILVDIGSYYEMRELQNKLSRNFSNLTFDFVDNSSGF